jgi:hypothetical protein
LLFLLLSAAGCSQDEEKQSAIREKVRAGDYEEAARWAHQYFDDDKRMLVVMLEYIADQQSKARKGAYNRHVVIQDVQLLHERSDQFYRSESRPDMVIGRLVNRGDKTITGFGLRVACIKDGKTLRETRALFAQAVPPGLSTVFRQPVDGFTDCQDVTIQIIDLGIKD